MCSVMFSMKAEVEEEGRGGSLGPKVSPVRRLAENSLPVGHCGFFFCFFFFVCVCLSFAC